MGTVCYPGGGVMYTYRTVTDPEEAWLLWQAGLLYNAREGHSWCAWENRDGCEDYASFLREEWEDCRESPRGNDLRVFSTRVEDECDQRSES